jgi:HSP20 family molecular chaperone IbpA
MTQLFKQVNNPWNYLEQVTEQLNFLNKSFFPEKESSISFPKYEIVEHSDKREYELHVPGLKKEDLVVTAQKATDGNRVQLINLNINGKKTRKATEGNVLYSTLYKRSFSISFTLDAKVFDEDSIESLLEDGVLKLTIKKFTPEQLEKPKVPEVKTIEIK